MTQGSKYPEDIKATAVARTLVKGSKIASEETGVPRRTIAGWVKSPAFADLRQRARDEIAEEMWVGVQVAVKEVVDGLTNPRTPLRDKAQALGVLYDRYALLMGSATVRTETRDITGTLSDAELDAAIREAQLLVRGEAVAAPEGAAPEEPGD